MSILTNILLCLVISFSIFEIKKCRKELRVEKVILKKLRNISTKPNISLEEYNSILNLRTNS